MPEPNSGNIVSTGSVPGNNYDVTDMGPLGGFSKPYPGAEPGHGWSHIHEVPDANGDGWVQS